MLHVAMLRAGTLLSSKVKVTMDILIWVKGQDY